MPEFRYDQAIFTSVRTPTGEGYRVIAASRGVKPEEKQALTRWSPSHQGLCAEADRLDQSERVAGLACYPLPSGRLCVAMSMFAGAEHTARGGQRIYTINVFVPPEDLPAWQYNMFNVARCAHRAGLTEPQLKPEKTLPEVSLDPQTGLADPGAVLLHANLLEGYGRCVLEHLLQGERVVVSIEDGWIPTAEALLLGVPGPMRAEVSFAAGLQFSISRKHHLTVLDDAKSQAKNRLLGQPVEYVDPQASRPDGVPQLPWHTLVQSKWEQGDFAGLAERTGRPFSQTDAEARNRIGEMFQVLDSCASTPGKGADPSAGMAFARKLCTDRRYAQESSVASDVLAALSRSLVQAVHQVDFPTIQALWPNVTACHRAGESGAAFAAPIVERMISTGMVSNPLAMAELVRASAADSPCPAWLDRLEKAAKAVADWSARVGEEQAPALAAFAERWSGLAVPAEAIATIRSRCEQLGVTAR